MSTVIGLSTLLLLFFASPSTSAADGDPRMLLHAKKLIRDLNLFPEDNINIVDAAANSSLRPRKIVEKHFRFPNLVYSDSGISVEDLGHHAGYYPIQHSHAARYGSCELNFWVDFFFFSWQ